MTKALAKKKKPKVPDGTFDLEEELKFIMYLARDVLGYDGIDKLHVSWFRDALTCPELLFIAPRSHYKTTVFTIIYVIYRILRNHEVRILILNEVLGNAKDFLTEIKTHFEQNDRLRHEFGELDKDAPKWTAIAIQIKSNRMTKDPTVAVAGTLGAINSKHVDLVLGDDLISDKNTSTINQRNKSKRWLLQTVFPILEPTGQMILHGTRWHPADLYSEFLDSHRYDSWVKRVLVAEWTDTKGKHHVLFPKRFTAEKLAKMKLQMGTAFYNAQYLNDPTSLQGMGYQRGWLKFYITPPAEMVIWQGVDLAISQEEHSAMFAHVTIGIPKEGTIYILNIVHDKLDFPQQCHVLKQQARFHNPIRVGIESNAYQQALPQWLRADPEAKKYPWTDTPTRGEKKMRLTSLSALFEQGVIYVKEDMDAFIDEYMAFPSGGTFDILDAFYFAIEVSKDEIIDPQIVEVHL